MFAHAAMSISVKHRASGAHALSEVIATAGLILVIFALARAGKAASAPAAVGAYIGAAYWFTASTSFAVIWTRQLIIRPVPARAAW